jgi:hypothetical protein
MSDVTENSFDRSLRAYFLILAAAATFVPIHWKNIAGLASMCGP